VTVELWRLNSVVAPTAILQNSAMSLGLVLMVVLALLLAGGFSRRFGGYGYGYGRGCLSLIAILLIIVLVLLFSGRF
jgi:hypothetical protein